MSRFFCNMNTFHKHFKYAVYLIAILYLSTSSAISAEISIYDLKMQNYPKVRAKIYPIDDFGRRLNISNKSQLSLFENDTSVVINSIHCPSNTSISSLSAVLTIDISSSMTAERIDLARNGAIEWVQLFPADSCETAVTLFNHDSYLNHTFSSKKQSLLQSLNYITAWGGTNYNAALIGKPFGAFSLLESAKFKNKSIVLLTDGLSQADEKTIIELALKNNIKIFSIIIGMPAPNVLKAISEQTGGLWWEDISELWQIRNIYRTVLMQSLGAEPCEIEWTSISCADLVRVSLFADFAPSGARIDYIAPAQKRARIEFEPASHLSFPIIQKDDTYELTLKIIANNADIQISSIEPPLKNFSISDYGGTSPPFTLRKDSSRSIKVRYSPRDTIYYVGDFNFIGDFCGRQYFTASGGKPDSIGSIAQLHIISPNGLEKFGIFSKTNIQWSGVAPSDTILITYSGNGFTWDTISRNASNMNLLWDVPDRIGETYLLKIIQFSKDINYNNLKIFREDKSRINAISFSRDGKLGVSAGNSILARSSVNGSLISDIASGLSLVKSISWDPSGTYLARTGDDNNIIVWNYLVSDDAHGFSMNDRRITSAKWSRNGVFLAGSSVEGRLSLWRFPAKFPERTVLAYDSSISTFAITSNADLAAIASENGLLKLFNTQNGNEIRLIDIYTSRINSLDFSPNEDYLLVALEQSRIEIWNTAFYDLSLRLNSLQGIVHKALFSNNKTHFAALIGNTIRIYTSIGGKEIAHYSALSPIIDFDWAEDGYKIAAGMQNGEVHIFDFRDLPYRRTIIQEDVSDDYWAIVEPKFKLNTIDFGKITIGQSLDSLFEYAIFNDSDIPFAIDSISISGEHKENFILRTFPPSDNINIQSFFPIELRAFSETLGRKTTTFNLYSKSRAFTSEVVAEFVPPILSQSDYYIDFGKINIDEQSVENTIEINNLSNDLIRIDSVIIFGLFADNFLLLNEKSFNIEYNSSYILKFQFSPKQYGKQSVFAKLYYNHNSSPIRIFLYGDAIAPEVILPDTIIINQILCNGSNIQIPINIKNTGNGILLIKSFEFSDEQSLIYLDSSVINRPILSNDSLNWNLKFNPIEAGSFEFTIKLLTNTDRYFNNSQEILFQINLESNSIEIVPIILSFEPSNEFEEEVKSIIIKNNNSKPLQINLPIIDNYFEVIRIDNNPIEPYSITEMQIRFKGGTFDSLYLANFILTDQCNESHKIYLTAAVGGGVAITESYNNLLFERIICDFSEQKQTLELKNTGNMPLIIYNMQIIGNDNIEVRLEGDNPIILPSSSKNILLTQRAGKYDANVCELIISTNSQNDVGGERRIAIETKSDIFNIVFDKDTINFGELRKKITKTERVVIYNTGDLPIEFNTMPKGEYFEFNSIIPKRIQVGGSALASIKFNGGLTNNSYSEILKLTDSCSTEYSINLFAHVSGYPDMSIAIDNVSGKSGDLITIPIRISNIDTSLIGHITEINTSISFNANLLFPVPPTQIGQIESGYRTLNISLVPSKQYDEPIEYLYFKAMLGDTNKTPIQLSNSRAISEIPIVVEEIDGMFELLDICDVGGLRLISSTGVLELLQNYPNPAKRETIIIFGIIEEGLHRLSVYNYLGKHLINLLEAELSPGQYKYTFDTEILPIGAYIYLLETPSTFLTRKLQILR